MNKKRILGMLIALSGLFLIFSDFKLTGAVIGLPSEPVVKVAGMIIFLVGISLIATAEKEYRERESRLKKIMGRKFESLSEEERNTYIKSYRRHEKKEEKKIALLDYSPEKIKYLQNEATEALKRGYIPERTSELIQIAKQCGYNLFSGGEGTIVRDSRGNKITEIGGHNRTERIIAKKVLKAMAIGKFYGKKSA